MDYCDSSVIAQNGMFYLFTTVTRGKGNELLLYHSDSFDGDYVPHPLSPVVVGDRFGRNGGALLEHDGTIYRFAQDCEGQYGKDINMFKVNVLSSNHYQEEICQENVLTSNGLSSGHQYNFVKFKGKYIVAVDQKLRLPFIACKVKKLFNLLKR